MGKNRRHTAKTGDKSLYNTRVQQSQIVERNSIGKGKDTGSSGNSRNDDLDLIYDEVDQFHNNDYLRLDHDMGGDDDDDEDSDGMGEEEVMRLDGDDDGSIDENHDSGVPVDDDDDDDSTGEYDDDDDEEEPIVSSDEDDENEANVENDIRDWGMKKTAYYYGDTADLEIGQEEEDAILEEDAAKDVLVARYQDMTEEDFMVDENYNQDGSDIAFHHHHRTNDADYNKTAAMTSSSSSKIKLSQQRMLQQLSTKEKRQLLNQQHHAEFIPLLAYFTQKMILPYTRTTCKATNAIFYSKCNDDTDDNEVENTADSIGATRLGQQYLLSKAMIQSSAMLNVLLYLLLKTEHVTNADNDMVDPTLIQSHPVMHHLEKLNTLYSKLEDGIEKKVDGLTDQLETLAKAADYLNDPTTSLQDTDESDLDEGEDNESDDDDLDVDLKNGDMDAHTLRSVPCRVGASKSGSNIEDEYTKESDVDDDDVVRRETLNEARFGLRRYEIQNLSQAKSKREERRRNIFVSDAGDDDDMDDVQRKKSGQALATTLNTIEQRTSTNHKRTKRSSQQLVEHIDDHNDEEGDGELRRGLEMMEEALGAPSDDEEQDGTHFDPELDDYDNGENDFYTKMAKKSKSMKDKRKERYAVTPKFPRVENDIIGDRTASKQILKNRGLVAHKAKINRNPRVKHREKFRKANIRRGGAVQAIRSPSEGDRYGGEVTGISTNVVRSRKLG